MTLRYKLFRVTAVLVMLALSLSLAGCYDQREIDELAYPLAIGLDVGEADALRVSLQLAIPLAISGGGGGDGGGGGVDGGGEKGSSSVITVDAPSFYTALNTLNEIISKEITVAHTKVIVVSRRLAESDMEKYLRATIRGREFRPDIFLVVTDGAPSDYLKNVKPVLENNPSKYYELLFGKSFSSYFPVVRLSDFYFKTEADYIQPVAILSNVGKYKDTDDVENSLAQEKKQGNADTRRLEGQYEAGDIPVTTQKQNEVMGMAVFKDKKMVGTANGAESACYHLVTGEYKYSYWSIPDPQEMNRIVVLYIMQRKKPSIKVDIQNDRATVRIHIDLEGDFESIQSGLNYEKDMGIIEQAAGKLIKEQVEAFLKKTTDQFDSDICGFGRYVKGKFLTWKDWKAFNWPEKYKNTSFSVDVHLRMRRSGLVIRTVE